MAYNFLRFFFSGNTIIYLTVTFLVSCRVSFDFGHKLFISGTWLVWPRLKKATSKRKLNVIPLKSKFNEFGAFSSIIQDVSCPTLIKLSLTRGKLHVNIVTFDHPVFLHLTQILKQFCMKREKHRSILITIFFMPEKIYQRVLWWKRTLRVDREIFTVAANSLHGTTRFAFEMRGSWGELAKINWQNHW